MGRSSTPISDLRNYDHLSGNALQNGTPKWLPEGEQRACYAMVSNNTSQATGGLVFYDKYFQQVRASTRIDSSASLNTGNIQYGGNGDAQTQASMFSSVAATQTQTSSNSTANYLNGTNVAGEFGNALIDAFSNSTGNPVTNRHTTWNNKHYLNRGFMDSDHNDQSIAYTLQSGVLRAISRIWGNYQYDKPGTIGYTLTDINTAMYGSLSYNNVRKELIGLRYNNSGGAFQLVIWKNVDFDRFPSPDEAMTRPEVVKISKAIASMPSWSVNNNESYYNVKPVLCDNGDIYLVVMFTSSSLTLYKITRDDADTPTVTLVSNRSLTTSYGADQDPVGLGTRKMQSRDGGAVCIFCPYYYYGTGLAAWIIDKRKSTYNNNSLAVDSNSSNGVQPIPYGDSGFAFYYAGNVCAGNYSGGYIKGGLERDRLGNLVQVFPQLYLPYFTLPNTTNYPGFTQVVDYSMITNQTIV